MTPSLAPKTRARSGCIKILIDVFSGLSAGHLTRNAQGGTIALVEEADRILMDIPNRRIKLDMPEGVRARR